MPDLVLYDGVCGLCNRVVQFILERDRRDRFRFACLQGELAIDLLRAHGHDASLLNTIYVAVDYEKPGAKLLNRSRAAIHILRRLGGPWTLAGVLRILPNRLMDFLYDILAKRRYAVFGQSDSCMIPEPHYRRKFLDAKPW